MHTFLRAAFCLSCVSYIIGAGPAAAQPQAPAIGSLSELPAEIRDDIGPDVSDRGGPFSPGCVSANGAPHSRFASASIDGAVARVKIERGGIAHFFDTLEYRLLDGHWVRQPGAPG
jgi:hypothetical protein